jgi:hypothetical protein
MGSKIKTGDWVMAPHGQTYRVDHIDGDGEVSGSHNGGYHHYHWSNLTKLPASPADMAKSHNMLMSHCEYLANVESWTLTEFEERALNHCRRLTTKQSRRSGKGKSK